MWFSRAQTIPRHPFPLTVTLNEAEETTAHSLTPSSIGITPISVSYLGDICSTANLLLESRLKVLLSPDIPVFNCPKVDKLFYQAFIR